MSSLGPDVHRPTYFSRVTKVSLVGAAQTGAADFPPLCCFATAPVEAEGIDTANKRNDFPPPHSSPSSTISRSGYQIVSRAPSLRHSLLRRPVGRPEGLRGGGAPRIGIGKEGGVSTTPRRIFGLGVAFKLTGHREFHPGPRRGAPLPAVAVPPARLQPALATGTPPETTPRMERDGPILIPGRRDGDNPRVKDVLMVNEKARRAALREGLAVGARRGLTSQSDSGRFAEPRAPCAVAAGCTRENIHEHERPTAHHLGSGRHRRGLAR